MSDDERTDPGVQLPAEPERLSTRPPAPPARPTFPPLPTRSPSLRARKAPPPLPSARATQPPTAMPKPSDPPPRTEASVAQRQRLAQMEAQLENAYRGLARQQAELEALQARVESGDIRLSELAARHGSALQAELLEQRLAELEEASIPSAPTPTERPPIDTGAQEARIAHVEERIRVLEEREGEARIRMRLERATHRMEELDARVKALETAQHAIAEALQETSARLEQSAPRLARLESLFEELADEVRAERDTLDLDSVRARLDDVETLVLSAGSGEASLKKQIDEQARALEALRAQAAPELAAARRTAREGDDLTRIKGVGPKYARLLRDLGTTTFAEIAAWTDDDVERVAAELGIAAARIHKAGWVDAARALESQAE